jgi:hypothetical protein
LITFQVEYPEKKKKKRKEKEKIKNNPKLGGKAKQEKVKYIILN